MYNGDGEIILGSRLSTFIQGMFLVAGVLSLTACSSTSKVADVPFISPYQIISVNTPGVYGAECSVQTGSRFYSVHAPGSVEVARAPDTMEVTCLKGEHMVGVEKVKPLFSPSDPRLYSGDCQSCLYPGMVTVAMAIDPHSLQTNVRHWRP